MKRAAFYVDGFNLFHAIDDLKRPYLKWVNLVALAKRIIPSRDEFVSGITQCTALPLTKGPQDVEGQQKLERHRRYISALKYVEVKCLVGHFIEEEVDCKATCLKQFVKRTEKQGDVNLAISIIDDGHMNLYDHAYLVTNDTDQVATLRMFNHRFIHLGKKVSVVTPPGRIPSGQLKAMVGNKQRMLKDTDIENCLFPSRVSGIVRPTEYDPPTGFALSPAPLQTISSLIPKPPAPNWGHDTKVRTVSASIEH